MSLALKYRPTRFEDLVGQRAVQVFLPAMIAQNAVPTALRFEGSRGTGKTTTARILAAALNCEAESGKPCGSCASCLATFAGSSLDVIEIDAASNGLVADIRELRDRVRYRASSNCRVVILDEAQSISDAGFNALLKTLEEPPDGTVFILCTTEPSRIPVTVASRCMPFSFSRLAVADIAGQLAAIARREGFAVDQDLLSLLAERADGAMRDAIMLLDQISRVGITTGEQYQRLLGYADHAPAILGALASGQLVAAFERLDHAISHLANPNSLVNDMIGCLRDVLVLRCGADINKTGVALADRQTLALALESPLAVAALRILWELKTKARLDDARSNLELAVVMLHDVLSKDRRMTLAQMGAGR